MQRADLEWSIQLHKLGGFFLTLGDKITVRLFLVAHTPALPHAYLSHVTGNPLRGRCQIPNKVRHSSSSQLTAVAGS